MGVPGEPSCTIEELPDSDSIADEPADNLGAGDSSEPAPSRENGGVLNGAQGDELRGESWGKLGPLKPPENCVKITEDGGVLKKVLVEGEGDPPKMYARCLVHYIGRIQSTGCIFIDTRTESATQQPVRLVAGKDASPRETGLSRAVATMRPGERAAVYVQDHKYGYGEAGSFSFPAVPPAAALAYEVEVVDWEDPDAQDEAALGGDGGAGLLYEERLERAEQRRLAGNELFAAGRYREAMGKYAVALSYLDEDFMMQLEGHYEDQANAVKVPIHLNMAACQLRIKDYHTAIYNCTEVLKLEPGSVKALFRRGTARHALGQTEGALADLTAAADKAPHDAAIARELAALRHTLKEERRAQARLFGGKLEGGLGPDGAPEQPPQASQAGGEGAGVQPSSKPGPGPKAGGGGGSGSSRKGDGKGDKGDKPEVAPEVEEVRKRVHAQGARQDAAGAGQGRGLLVAVLAWLGWLAGMLGLRLRARPAKAGK